MHSLHGHANSDPRAGRGGSAEPWTSSPRRDERSRGEGADAPAAAGSPPLHLFPLFIEGCCSSPSLLRLFLRCSGSLLSPKARPLAHSHFWMEEGRAERKLLGPYPGFQQFGLKKKQGGCFRELKTKTKKRPTTFGVFIDSNTSRNPHVDLSISAPGCSDGARSASPPGTRTLDKPHPNIGHRRRTSQAAAQICPQMFFVNY